MHTLKNTDAAQEHRAIHQSLETYMAFIQSYAGTTQIDRNKFVVFQVKSDKWYIPLNHQNVMVVIKKQKEITCTEYVHMLKDNTYIHLFIRTMHTAAYLNFIFQCLANKSWVKIRAPNLTSTHKTTPKSVLFGFSLTWVSYS